MRRIAGMGRIVSHKREDDGKFRLTVEGIARIRLLGDAWNGAHALVEAEVLSGYSTPSAEAGGSIQDAYRELVSSVDRMVRLLPQWKGLFRKIMASHPHPGVVADLLAHNFVAEDYDKQCILEELDVLRRIQLVNVQILKIVEHFARVHFRDKL